MRRRLATLGLIITACSYSSVLHAQTPTEKIDQEMVAKIKAEGQDKSQVMETISFLTDVHGPRLTGSPITKTAGEWTKGKLAQWGLENPRLEPWGPFGRGWTLEGCTVNLTEPNFTQIIAYPKAWSPSTQQTIKGEPIYLDAETPADLDKYRGKLHRKIVLISPPRNVDALFEAPAARQTDEQLLKLANAEPAARRPRGPRGGQGAPGGNPAGGPGAAGVPGAPGAPTPGGPGAANEPNQPGAARGNAAATTGGGAAGPDPRTALQIQTDKWQLCYDEGAAVVLEPGRGDGGTVFVSAATLPRRPDAGRGNGAPEGAPNRAAPRPWSVDAPEIIPQLVVAVEHYNRIVRMVQKDAHPELEIDIAAKYHTDDLNSFNIIAEIPGTDLKDEVVMLGAHFDSWHSGTGATDNAVGCGVALEAVRILKAVGAQPRRTIRIGLWTGEEQGLFGSKAYVTEHLGKSLTPPDEFPGRRGEGRSAGSGDRPKPKIEVTPEYEKFSAYFNLDNGTGKIRGIYLQGNEPTRPIFRTWLSPFSEMGASTITASNTGGTDHLSFDSIGLPGFQFIQDPLEYDTRTHHSSMDVYERVQPDDAKQASIIMATFVYNAATRDEKFPRKPLEADLVPASGAAPIAPAAAGAATLDATVAPAGR